MNSDPNELMLHYGFDLPSEYEVVFPTSIEEYSVLDTFGVMAFRDLYSPSSDPPDIMLGIEPTINFAYTFKLVSGEEISTPNMECYR